MSEPRPVIRVDAVEITVGGQLWDGVDWPAEKVFHMSPGGTSSTGEIVSVLKLAPGDRVRWKPLSSIRTVAHVTWVLGAIAVTTDDNLRWYFEVSGDGWPTAERVTEERRP